MRRCVEFLEIPRSERQVEKVIILPLRIYELRQMYDGGHVQAYQPALGRASRLEKLLFRHRLSITDQVYRVV